MSESSTPEIRALHSLILTALSDKTKAIVEEEALAAAGRVSERVRSETGSICAKISTWMDFERMRDQLVITLKIDDKNL